MSILAQQSILGDKVTLKENNNFYWLVEPIKCSDLCIDSSGSLDDVKKYIQRKIKSTRKILAELDNSETEVIAIYKVCVSDWRSLLQKVTCLTMRSPDSLKAGDSCPPDVVKSESNSPAAGNAHR